MKVPEDGLRLLLEVSKRSITKFLRHYMSSWAAALAYHALFAIVPFLALLVALVWLLGIGNFFIEGLVGLDEMFISLWTWLRLPVALALLMLAVSIVYWAVPNVNYPYRLITPGAALAVIAWVLGSLGFSFYLSNFANYSAIYGSLGVAFALLIYFYISAAVLLFGAEVNAAIHHYTWDRHMQVEEHTTGH